MSSRTETLLNSIASGEPSGVTPKTREEAYLSYIAGESDTYPTTPTTRKEFYLDKIAQNGAGGGPGGSDIDFTLANATESDVLSGKTFYAQNKTLKTGTLEMPSGGGETTENKLAKLIDGTITEMTANDWGGATNIRSYCFSSTNIASVEMADTITTIEGYAFRRCSTLTHLKFSNNLLTIGGSAFVECKGLKEEIIIPNSVTTIGQQSFYSCTNIPKITVGTSVTLIQGDAFNNVGSSSNKPVLVMLPTTPPTLQSNAISSYFQKIIVPKGCLSAYQSATNWSALASIMEEATE